MGLEPIPSNPTAPTEQPRKVLTSMSDSKATYLLTSESVSEGHPDKICDQISDAVLDAVMAADPSGRVACETSVTTGLVLVFGEISTTANLDVPKIVRETIKGIGYDNPAYGFDGDSCSVLVAIDEQSTDIAAGVGTALEARGDDGADQQTGGRRTRA